MSMVTETAEVVAVEEGHAWIETQRKAVCDSCAVQKGCGSGIISRMFSKRTRIRVPNTIGARVGEQVVVGIEDATLVRASLAVYLMPLLWMMLGALAGQILGEALMWTYAEAATALFGMLGLAAGFLWLRHYAARAAQDGTRQPNLLGYADEFEEPGATAVLEDRRPGSFKARGINDSSL